MQKWDYKEVVVTSDGFAIRKAFQDDSEEIKGRVNLIDYLKELGELGWEAFSHETIHEAVLNVRYSMLLLKRPLDD